MFFFFVAPFCSCPASLVSRKFFAVGPGCAKCFFFCAPLGAATFRRGQSKKKTTPRVFFFLLRPRGKAGEGEVSLGAGTGPEQKKKHHPGCFFCCGPGERQGKEKPRWKPARGQSKKETPPRVFFFLLWPRAGAQRGFSFPCLSPGPQQKKNTLGGVFFFALAPCRRPTGLLLPLPFAGAAAKKNTLGGVFFFCCGPARTLTHSLRAWVAMPPPRRGGVIFFAAAPPGPGWCFFFCCGPARTLTHSRRFRQGPGGVFFFAAAPPGLFRQ